MKTRLFSVLQSAAASFRSCAFNNTETSWEPEANLDNAQEAIDDYYAAHPRKKRI